MDAHTLMEEWEESPFDGGLDGVRDLQSRGFSGAVEVGGSTLFLRDGDPIAVVEDLVDDPRPGDLDAFEGAVGDLHTAGRSETATLAAMLALDGDVRGQYFTEDTPLSTVHETLSEGGFTGYVELSENVLSGDYYVVYRDGREEYIAFVGSSNRVLVDEDARTRAEGEVGIYSVVGVTLPDVDVPRPDESGSAVAGGTSFGGSATGDTPAGDPTDGEGTVDSTTSASAARSDEPTPDAAGKTAASDAESVGETAIADAESAEESAIVDADVAPAAQTNEAAQDGRTTDAAAGARTGDEAESEPDAANENVSNAGDATTESASMEQSVDDREETTAAESGEPDTLGDTTDAAEDSDDSGQTSSGSEASVIDAISSRTVPSLDPQQSRPVQADGTSEAASTPVVAQSDPGPASVPQPRTDDAEGSSTQEAAARETAGREPAEQEAAARTGAVGSGGRDPEPAPGPDVEERVEAVREEYEGRLRDLRSEVQELRAERDDLRRRIESLQSRSGGAGAGDDAGVAGGPAGGTLSLSPSEAMANTSLFVREGTRGGATLDRALDGEADRETLAENVRVEYHTEFDDDGATVESQPFEEWLHGTAHYRFVRWAIVDLLFEIRSTGAASSMRPLYEALPAIDRVGLRDAVAVGEDDGAREITFDVVARDQMGDPLFVATIDERREPTSGGAMEPLVTDAADVCEYHESLVGTFAVTSSYFEPAALDTVREATSGSLLGRDRYRSYVKLARKNGFHLCMVERRNADFHLTVPEL